MGVKNSRQSSTHTDLVDVCLTYFFSDKREAFPGSYLSCWEVWEGSLQKEAYMGVVRIEEGWWQGWTGGE